uniref:G-protein coupled receptors family 1 profile domain-containing protein n=1 Tax=Scleropages formosus TaxID=113540 RepID=A0A8C9VT56_SCLFO
MSVENQTSATDFFIVGFPGLQQNYYGLVGTVFFLVYFFTLVGNAAFLVLFTTDRNLHKPMYCHREPLPTSTFACVFPDHVLCLALCTTFADRMTYACPTILFLDSVLALLNVCLRNSALESILVKRNHDTLSF